jgi:hypothetical protein
MSNDNWIVDKNRIRTDYPVIENLQQFLADAPPLLPKYHPEYIKYWSLQTKRCIEGIWRKEFGKWRYMPGNLYFFGNFSILEDTQIIKGVKKTKHFKPKIVDFLWEFAYQSWAAYGFSGFEKDDVYSCNMKIPLFLEGKIEKEDLPLNCLNSKQEVKKFVHPFEYLSKLHNDKLGLSLFENECWDTITLGTRGGGKSYWVGLGELEYNFIFCGARRYDDDFKRGILSSRQLVGSSDKTKSSELLDKFKTSQDAKVDNKNPEFVKWFGIYVEKYVDNKGNTREIVTPCPFYKRALGTLAPNNKDNIYRAGYKINSNGEFKEKGTGCEIGHVNYSHKKTEGFTAGVGGRYLFADIEEVGLSKNFIDIKGANDAGTKRNGVKMGVQHAQGTSGFLEYIQEAKKVMLNPEDYSILSYQNAFSHSGTNNKIGYYLPNTMVHFDCKDENGNTLYDKVIQKINQKRAEKANSADPQVLRDFLMNEPVYLEEMWLTDKGYYLPYEEALIRESELLKNGYYKQLMTCVELVWDESLKNKVDYKILHDADPYIDFPHDNAKTKDPSGCVVIYKFPTGDEPNDYYLFSHDPYIEENINKGGSVGVTHVYTNPKYIQQGLDGNTIVATYIGKPIKGLSFYNEQLEKLLAFYGNPYRGLWYEKNRGEEVRSHFITKGKSYLLGLTPQYSKGSNVYQKDLMSYGVMVGNREAKLQMLKYTYDWLLEETELLEDGLPVVKRAIFRIPCLYTIRQIKQYNLEGNYDAVSSLLIGVLGLKEINAIHKSYELRKNNTNSFKSILNNQRIFNNGKHTSVKNI